MESRSTTSLWLEGTTLPLTAPLDQDASADVCIIGSGIAGLTTAYLLLKEGLSVIVLEKAALASGESSRTTAHLVNVLDDRFYNLENYHGEEGARLAAESHTAAISMIEKIVLDEKIACEFRRVNGYLFAGQGRSSAELEKELHAMRKAGLTTASLIDNAPILSFSTGPCIAVMDQAKMQPVHYYQGLFNTIVRMGGRIFTDTKVKKVKGGDQAMVEDARGHTVRCGHIVVATNTPVNDQVTLHLKQGAYRTYVITVHVPKNTLADALYWDTGDPYHYIRIDPDHTDEVYDLLTIGGEDHRTGKEDDPQKCYERLEQWTRSRFPISGIVCRWSGQVMEPHDGLAYIGRNPRDHRNVYIISGDSGNGMTHGTIGGMLITDLIKERKNPWEDLYSPCRHSLHTAAGELKELASTTGGMLDWLKSGNELEKINNRSGAVIRKGLMKVAVYKDEYGNIHALDATCPHLGCLVRWNASEHSWDCPCHGSRFDVNGKVLNGPSVSNLKPYNAEVEK